MYHRRGINVCRAAQSRCTFSQIFGFNRHFVFDITLPKPFKTHYFGSNTLFASLGSDPDTSRSQFPSSSAQIYVLGLAKTIFGSQAILLSIVRCNI